MQMLLDFAPEAHQWVSVPVGDTAKVNPPAIGEDLDRVDFSGFCWNAQFHGEITAMKH
jgi:hypothetical protein